MKGEQLELFPQIGQVFKVPTTGWYVICDSFNDFEETIEGRCLLVDVFNDIHVYDQPTTFPWDKLSQDLSLDMVELVKSHLDRK